MEPRGIYIFLFDGYSDWEIAYLTPELFKSREIILKTFTLDGSSIISMGGLKISPDLPLKDIKVDEIFILVLPGGTAWEHNEIQGMDGFVKELLARGKTIAAICSATTYLAEQGYIDNVKHTSNNLNYLKKIAPNYKGEVNYQSEPVVTDQNIITANGISPIEFAAEIFRKIKLHSEADIEKWYQLYKNGIWTG